MPLFVPVLLLTGFCHAGTVSIDTSLGALRGGETLEGPVFGLDDDAGKRSGQNLLISLKQFDLARGDVALFSSSLPTRNIITRITGGSASRIDGSVVSQVPGASLYLINPSGLIIGAGAQFEVDGALHLSTAHSLEFADGATLDTRGGPVPTLSSAEPAAFGFLSAPASISLRSAKILPPQQTLPQNVYSITGGSIGLTSSELVARGGLIAIHSGASEGRVTIPTLTDPGTRTFTTGGRVTIQSEARLEADNSGQIAITGRILTLDDSDLTALASATDGKSITLSATHAVTVANASSIRGGTEGAGNAPAININGKTVNLQEASVVVNEQSTRDPASPAGTGGSIAIAGDFVNISTGTQIVTSNGTAEQGGSVSVNANQRLTIQGRPGEFTGIQTDANATGGGGDITLSAPEISITRSAQVQSRSKGLGNAGDVVATGGNMTLDAENFDVTGLASRAGQESTGGNSGDVTVNLTGDLLIRRGGAITASTFGPGRGGDVVVNANNITIREPGVGNTDSVTGQPFNGIFARSSTPEAEFEREFNGTSGSVQVTARGDILLELQSTIGANAEQIAPDQRAGDVSVSASTITVRSGSTITAASNANGGSVLLSADTVLVDQAILNASAQGDGGRFTIAPTDVVVLVNGAVIDALANGLPDQTTIDPSATLLQGDDTQILASSPTLPPDVDIAAGLLRFDISFADSFQRLRADCNLESLRNTSTFTVEPRGGLQR